MSCIKGSNPFVSANLPYPHGQKALLLNVSGLFYWSFLLLLVAIGFLQNPARSSTFMVWRMVLKSPISWHAQH